MDYKNNLLSKKRKAFTLIELLIVIAIIGILFIVLVSKVDFATDKAKATGVQTDFRSFQVAIESVAKEHAGLATFGWDTGDTNGDRVRNSYDKGDTNQNGIQDDGEVFVGSKTSENWRGIYTLTNPADVNDKSAIVALEEAINKNLDPKLHVTIHDDLTITMANGAQDPWDTEYHGYYITNAERDKRDRGAIVIYSNGANQEFGSNHSIAGGIVTVNVPGNNVYGKDDYSVAVIYTYFNGYGEVKTTTTGFSNNQGGGQAGTDGTFIPGLGNGSNGDSHTPLVSAPEFAGATFRGYLTCSHTTNGLSGHNDSCFVYEEVTLTWEELKDPANGEKYSYDASAIGDTVLGESAFEDCHTIASINIPEGVTIIEDVALGWTYIHDVKLPSTLKEIGEDVFSCMYGEADLYIPDGVESLGYSVAYQTGIRSIRIPGTVKVVPEYAFECSPFLRTVILEEGIERIESATFDYSGMLTDITIPSTVTYIGEYAFGGNTSLITIDFAPNSQLKEIGERAFNYNHGLISVTIPESVTSIASEVFTDCPKLVEIINLSNVTITSDMVDDLNKIDIHNGSTKVINQNGYLFYNIDGVDYLMGTDGITGTAQPPAYYNGKTYKLHSYVFCGEHGIDNYIIPNTITEIPDGAFATNYKTDSIFIPSSVTTLGDGLIGNVTWSDGGPNPDDYYFYPDDRTIVTIIFEDNSTLQNVNENVWAAADSDVVNIHITDVNNWVQFSFNYYNYTLYVNGQIPTKIILNEGVTKIGKYAFYAFENLEKVVLPSSITKVEDGAIPTSLCTEYNNVYYIGNEENPYLVCVDVRALDDIITLHPDTKIIADEAFGSAKNVIMHEGVTHIGTRLFNISGTIKYVGTATDWSAINKDEEWYLPVYTWYNTRSSVIYDYQP